MDKIIPGLILAFVISCSSADTNTQAKEIPKNRNPEAPCENSKKGYPIPGTSWQWQLEGQLDTNIDVDLYDIDLFETPESVIDKLRSGGKTVICYFSAGSWEKYRQDADSFSTTLLGKIMDGWPDERWLDIRQIDLLRPIMTSRLNLAVQKGCHGVEPDNMDGYENDTGFTITYSDQLKYNKWLAEEAHLRNLSIGMKNDLGQVRDLVAYFDFAINEQCFQYNECDSLKPFIEACKAVFGVEYEGDPKSFCSKANALNFDWLQKNIELDAKRVSCREVN